VSPSRHVHHPPKGRQGSAPVRCPRAVGYSIGALLYGHSSGRISWALCALEIMKPRYAAAPGHRGASCILHHFWSDSQILERVLFLFWAVLYRFWPVFMRV
jgi:hypothetical protein